MATEVVPLFRLGNHLSATAYKNIFQSILDSGQWTLGKHTESFEKAFAKKFGHKHAVGVSNGTNAISLLLRSVCATEVWLSDTTFVGVWSAAMNAGVKTVKVVSPNNDRTWDVSYDRWMERLAKPRFKPTWIIVTHLYGSRSTVDIAKLKEQYGVRVIEDMSQCHGLAPSPHSDAQIYSLYPTKNLGSLGEAGIITTDSKVLASRVRANRFYGYNADKSKVNSAGNNYKMDELQAAFADYKLTAGTFDDEIKTRIIHANTYRFNMEPNKSIGIPDFSPDCTFHLFPIWVDDRDHFRSFMQENGVQTGNHYPHSITNMVDIDGLLENNTSGWNDHVVTLPMGGYHTHEEILRVCDVINSYKGV